MKKFVLLFACTLIFLLSGCSLIPTGKTKSSSAETVSSQPSSLQPASSTASSKTTAIAPSTKTLEQYVEGMEVYDSFTYDFDKDGQNEDIVLAVDAERGSDGKVIFDDGQEWALCIRMKDVCYPIFLRGYVQIGYLEYTLYESPASVPTLLISCRQGAGIQIFDCVYDSPGKQFIMNEVYNTGGINVLHSS